MKQPLLPGILLGAALAISPAFSAAAQDSGQEQEPTFYLKIVDVSGTELFVPFADKPEIVYVDDALLLTYAEDSIEYPDGTLDYFTITDEMPPQSGVAGLAAGFQKVSVNLLPGSMLFTKGTPGAGITACTTDGRLLGTATFNSDGEAILRVAPAKGETIIVKADKSSFKLIRK